MKQSMQFLFAMIFILLNAGTGAAHPMGNFSINHYSGLMIGSETIQIRYVLDFAEIPAFQEIQNIDRNQDGKRSNAEQETYLSQKIEDLSANLKLSVSGQRLPMHPLSHELRFPPGAGGLPTLRLSILYQADLPPSIFAVSSENENEKLLLVYRDENYAERVGWKEIVSSPRAGISLIDSPLPTAGEALKRYPEDKMQNPPQVVAAKFSFQTGSTKGEMASRKIVKMDRSTTKPGLLRGDAFTKLMTGVPPSGQTLFFALMISIALGAFHALSPGHGKTLVAAYLVGSQGTFRHALLLGLTVTFSHTIGVFMLGLITLYLSDYIVPEQLYPWLSRLSGLTIFFLGLWILKKRLTPHSHAHPHTHFHAHTQDRKKADLKGILGLGISGGIIPCPSALVVLLSAIAFHQLSFGLLLIVAFSAGLAATLVGIGLLVVSLGEVLNRSHRFGVISRYFPPLSAAGMAVLGLMIVLGGGW